MKTRYLLLVVVAAGCGLRAQQQTAGKAYKNIQVFNDLPASQLMTVMHQMRTSLGVRCDFCHVVEGNRVVSETDGPMKKKAREMMLMTLEVNKRHFGGKAEVTCNTCHQGRTRPAATPPIGQGQFTNTTRGTETAALRPLLTPTQILDHYVEASGGRAALEQVESRIMRGIVLRMKVGNPGTDQAIAINRGQEEPIEIKTADPRNDLRMRERAAGMAVVGTDHVNGEDVYVLHGTTEDGRREALFFDVFSGLLRRRTIYTATLLGEDPEQTDFEDYRDVAGLRLPFLVKRSYLDDNHLGVTLVFKEIQTVLRAR